MTAFHFEIHHNPRAVDRATYPFGDIVSVQRAEAAQREISRCPLYRPTPLIDLPAVAHRSGVARVFYKDEASRLGLGSFKALGGAYAVALLLQQRVAAAIGRQPSIADLARGRYRDLTRAITVACATDGNHGRAVAAGARQFGCQCVIFLHGGVSAPREAAIAAFGARTVRVPGNYDDSVRAAISAAHTEKWEIVSDTSWPGYHEVPAIVMQGYAVLVLEILQELHDGGQGIPTHVFLQGGVGGLAAACTGYLWDRLGAQAAPVVIVVEPERADCLYQSALSERPTTARGSLDTIMAGLACGEVSELAWQILHAAAEYFMTIPDDAAVAGMRLLARGAPAIVAGESATAGLAGLLCITDGRAVDDPLRREMRLDEDARVLLIGTEGATDPELYRVLVGCEPAR